ncbi:flagellar basal body rod protein FlgG [Halobacillus karajensis]|uniref:Flagellar hook protein FlgE n=1 Tax=Halobacillus karajensis TaxID=195088 RepID=A0A024P3I9_9BACI|nr:flagellar basal body rod protein FlgG [Halobacillus karajensis]CDQ19737.1 Distal rod protein [Halobacillus karajensis]CDQ22197.1 Distal rod protein [Halobacillus karajensis]CDQ28038.1 Distal rod protein [Halobacillus karajensis]
MLRSMYSGISGMKGFQTKLDTIGNNIANVNTYGYKKGRVTFQDMMSQTMSNAQGPIAGENGNVRGGLNPSQVGLGSQVGSIDTIHTQGNRQTTNRPLDLSLEGDGMFVLAEAGESGIDTDDREIELGNVNTSFTRAGNFYLDSEGAIVNNEGKYLVGQLVNENGEEVSGILTIPDSAQSFSIQTDGTVNYVDENGDPQVAGQVRLANFSNPSGLEKLGGNTFQYTENAGEAIDGLDDLLVAGQDGTGQMVAGALEMSNVDLAESFTEMITSQRGFQANTRIITTSDEILQELVNLKR